MQVRSKFMIFVSKINDSNHMDQHGFHKNSNFLSSVFETAIDAIIIINKLGIIQLLNKNAAATFGYEVDELIGQNINIIVPEPDKSKHDQYIKNHLETGINKIIGIGREVTGLKKDGHIFPVRLAVSKFIIEDQIYFTGVIHDLSAQKEAENKLWYVNRNLENLVDSRTGQLQESINQLSSSNRFLEHEIDFRITVEQKLKVREQELLDALEKERDLSLLKSRFVSIASHEFRTPLANILSSINLVDRYESAEFVDKRKVHISKIKNNIHYLNGILNEFLTLTRIEEGKFELKIESFEIHGMLHEIIEDFNLIKKTGQTLKLNTNNLEGALIETDKTCLKHIMNNLISNAIKYSGEHAIIEIELSKVNNFYNILVKDNGIGIPNTEQKFIFDIFYRGSNVLNIQGTGLGLNIVKKYLDTIKGNIRFESMETKGTQITIQLPEIFNYEKNSDH